MSQLKTVNRLNDRVKAKLQLYYVIKTGIKGTLKKDNTIRITDNSTCNDSPMVSTDTIGFIDSKTGEATGILAH